jgi:hypothetical protein
MFLPLSFQHFHCIPIQRQASRRSVLGVVQPRGPSLQVHTVPFQAGDRARGIPLRAQSGSTPAGVTAQPLTGGRPPAASTSGRAHC